MAIKKAYKSSFLSTLLVIGNKEIGENYDYQIEKIEKLQNQLE